MEISRSAAFALVSISLSAAATAGIVGSKHDLSVGYDPYSNQPCAFCHTPHSSNTVLNAPLWNRHLDRTKVFSLYSSATLDTVPGDPNNSLPSLLCLGCHDGTIGYAVVNGYTGSDKHDLVNAPGPGGIPDMTSWPSCQRCHGEMYGDPPMVQIGTDISNDHPIAITYPTAAQDDGFRTPPSTTEGWNDIPLFDGKVECSSCHQAHDPSNGFFLRIPNVGSTLCLTCHLK